MEKNILAVDLGGTKTHLQIYAVDQSYGLRRLREEIMPSRQYPGLEDLVLAFLKKGEERIASACFGVSGPVIDGRAKIVNLPWEVDSGKLLHTCQCSRVELMNDLETTALGALHLPPHELHSLNPGQPQEGHRAVIAAGTGLGQAFLFWDGKQYIPAATEGGHADFAPQTEFQTGLQQWLQTKSRHVSWEHVLSGSGLFQIFRYLTESLQQTPDPITLHRIQSEDPATVVGEMAISQKCPVCMQAVDVFLELYGAQAGNLALTVFALGGVYVGGGMIVKLLPRLLSGKFMVAFCAKGRFEEFMTRIPVQILLNPHTSVIGAAYRAAHLIHF